MSCFRRTNEFLVGVGLHDRTTKNTTHFVRVRKVVVHAWYDEENYLANDIALITLATPITTLIRRGIRASAIHLPKSALDNPRIGSTVASVGWGWTSNDAQSSSKLLQGATFPVLSVTECARLAEEREQSAKICIDASKKALCRVSQWFKERNW